MPGTQHPEPDDASQEAPEEGQVSEVAAAPDDDAPIAPEDATAGYPDSESGGAEEGTAGPNAAPRHDPPEDGNESSR